MRFRRSSEPNEKLTPGERRQLEYNAEVKKQLRGRWTPRRVLAWSLFGLALVIAIQHIFAHLGKPILSFSMGLQDLVIGWPMAGVIALVGLLILDAKPPPR